MPQGIHEVEVDSTIQTVWAFVSTLDYWTPLVPGYISHEIINDRQLIWTFTSDVAIIKKTISLQVDITRWNEPTEMKFTLTGISSNFVGEGFFKAKELEKGRTKMIGCLDITAKGLKGPMVNSILKTYLPQATVELVEAMVNRMSEIYSNPTLRQ